MFVFLRNIILFMVAVSAIRSVVNFIQRLGGWAPQPRNNVPRAPSAPQGTSTVLQQDPVCGTYVAIDTSLKRIVSGRVIHFCSPECRDRFVA